jgi:hypothetical protein
MKECAQEKVVNKRVRRVSAEIMDEGMDKGDLLREEMLLEVE